MVKIRLVIFFLTIAILSFPGYFLFRKTVPFLSGFLSKSEKVDADILIIEGWLSYNSLQEAIKEFQNGGYEYIFTTGLKATSEYYNVNTDGYLIFYPSINNFLSGTNPVHTIEAKVYSELEDENAAHFNFWINDSVMADFYADKQKRKYTVFWTGDLSEIDSVMIQFDNDIVGEFGDRNLFVKEIIFDHRIIIPFLNNSVYDISALDGRNRIINNMNSNAGLTRNRILSLGIDSTMVIAIPGEKVRINRTLTSALAVRNWLKTSDIPVKGINIVSSGTHSRRTWMTFDRVLDGPYKIGIIALADNRNSERMKVVKTLRETAAIIYYWFLLLPY